MGIMPSKGTCSSPQSLFLLHASFHLQPDVFGHVYNIKKKKNPGRRRRKKGPFWGNMARINLEILFYFIWTKLLVWTHLNSSRHTATAAQMGKEWSANLSLWPRCAHEPQVFLQLSFHAADQKHFFVIVGFEFIPTDSVSRETRHFLLLPPLLCLSCLFACVRKNEKKAKENRECVKKKKSDSKMSRLNINWSYSKSNGCLFGIIALMCS